MPPHNTLRHPSLSSWSFIKHGSHQIEWDSEWSSSGEGGISFLIKWEEKSKGVWRHRLGSFEEKKNIYLIHSIPPFLPPLSHVGFGYSAAQNIHVHTSECFFIFLSATYMLNQVWSVMLALASLWLWTNLLQSKHELQLPGRVQEIYITCLSVKKRDAIFLLFLQWELKNKQTYLVKVPCK